MDAHPILFTALALAIVVALVASLWMFAPGNGRASGLESTTIVTGPTTVDFPLPGSSYPTYNTYLNISVRPILHSLWMTFSAAACQAQHNETAEIQAELDASIEAAGAAIEANAQVQAPDEVASLHHRIATVLQETKDAAVGASNCLKAGGTLRSCGQQESRAIDAAQEVAALAHDVDAKVGVKVLA
jgi:hypothetical protein